MNKSIFRKFFFGLVFCLAATFSGWTASAQIPNAQPAGASNEPAINPLTKIAQYQKCKSINSDLGNVQKPNYSARLKSNVFIKVKLEAAADSKVLKTGDIIKFSVIEDVYGKVIAYNPKTDPAAVPAVPTATQPGTQPQPTPVTPDYEKDDRIIIIPKNTIGYGKVEYSKEGSPFLLNGVAKIRITLDYLIIPTGTCIPVKVNFEEDQRFENIKNSIPRRMVDCKHLNNNENKCIAGRRPSPAVASAIVSASTAGALARVKGDTPKIFAGITLFDQLSKNTGISSLIDGQNATINEQLILEVSPLEEKDYDIKPDSGKDK